MNLLWIDTASQACSVAIGNKDKLYDFETLPVKQGQAESLAVVIQQILLSNKLKANDIQKIVVTQGPGSFTAVRIGLSVARMLAQVLHIPCLGISNFELMYQQLQYQKLFSSLKGHKALSIHSFRHNPFIQLCQSQGLEGEPMNACAEMIKNHQLQTIITNSPKDAEFWESYNIKPYLLNTIEDKAGFLHYLIRHYIVQKFDGSSLPAPLYIRDADAKVSTKKAKKLAAL